MQQRNPKKIMSSNDTKIAVLETVAGHIHETLERLERRMDNMDKKLDDKFATLDNKIDLVNSRLWILLFWIISGFIGVLTLIAKVSHWF